MLRDVMTGLADCSAPARRLRYRYRSSPAVYGHYTASTWNAAEDSFLAAPVSLCCKSQRRGHCPPAARCQAGNSPAAARAKHQPAAVCQRCQGMQCITQDSTTDVLP